MTHCNESVSNSCDVLWFVILKVKLCCGSLVPFTVHMMNEDDHLTNY